MVLCRNVLDTAENPLSRTSFNSLHTEDVVSKFLRNVRKIY